VNKTKSRIWVGMSQIRETRDTITKFSAESHSIPKFLGIINSTDKADEKLVQITSARKSVSGPGPGYVAYVCVFLGSTNICQLYKLILTDQAQVTLQRISCEYF
jgi:hypothetical protein